MHGGWKASIVSRVAVVTGGGSGIGRAIVERLAHDRHRVAVLDVNEEAAEKVAARVAADGAHAIAVPTDVAESASVAAAFESVRRALGSVQVLVTSAAITGFKPFAEITIEDWNRHLAVNLTGTFLCLQAALPDMVEAGWGRVVTISSTAAQTGSPRQGHYSASKGGVIALTRTIALEYAAHGITANTVPPFSVDTPMLRAAQEAGNLPPVKYLAKASPVGRLGTGEDIAAACAFLCSDEAGYITGQIIGVNGGAVI
ncbi:SDR family NAD(P)-dependent oxidoreductase [Mycobacterium avium subsp. hominissuis]|nr:2-hydroxycyclohexanecarboxyl-CoA dehydrogenase [Mycobacterium avium subsp. hominissuis TH135]